MFEVPCFIDFGPYSKSFKPLENYINQLKEELTNKVINPSQTVMEIHLSKVLDQVPLKYRNGCIPSITSPILKGVFIS